MGAAEKEWQFDKFDDESLKIATEVQVRKFGRFLTEYTSQLRDIERVLDDSSGECWDLFRNPLSLEFQPQEHTNLIQLINTDNKNLNKVLLVLSALCREIEALKNEAEQRFYHQLQYYGEGDLENVREDGEPQIQIGRMIPLLQALSCFVDRCYEVVRHVVHQMSVLYSFNKNAPKVLNTTDIHFQVVYEHLGELLAVLITLDTVIENQTTFKDHWILYKRMFKSVRQSPHQFGLPESKLQPFEKVLVLFEARLLDGSIFQNCIEQSFDKQSASVSKNTVFSEDFSVNLQNCFGVISHRIGDARLETDEREQLPGVIGLYILHYHLFRVVDKKTFKQLWDLNKKIPSVVLLGSIIWNANEFLYNKLPHMAGALDKKALSIVEASRANYLVQSVGGLVSKEQALQTAVCVWMVQMEASVNIKFESINSRLLLVVQGLLHAYSIRHLVTTLMNLHVSLQKPMTKTTALSLCRHVELLKAIELTFHRRSELLADTFSHAVQLLSYRAMNVIYTARKRFMSVEKKFNDKKQDWKLDVLSALMLVESSLSGPEICVESDSKAFHTYGMPCLTIAFSEPGTQERRLITRLALACAAQQKVLKDEELSSVNTILGQLDLLCNFRQKLSRACDCSFMYWHRVVLPMYLNDLRENTAEAFRLRYMCSALSDCPSVLKRVRHLASADRLVESFYNEIVKQFNEQLLDGLCCDVETDLRLHIHMHLQLDSRNPFRVPSRQLSTFLRMSSFRLFDKDVCAQVYVEHYLNKTFYNLTTVALHDWKTYSEMRTLANQKYGLTMAEAHLPSQTLEQGLDVLEIMRNIHVFVSKYLYNLNNQIFVERSSNNKHLNTINIRHIANSIRTHGTGIMNTTVNFTYQFLTKKFFVFSQFMYDEHIKSKLIKDWRYFKEFHQQTDQKYPFERADKFNRGIRKLGLTPDGLSYLDQFRVLISQIGNAMGYIRMIRSGGLHCCSNAIQFVPDLDDIEKFEDMVADDNLSAECRRAARQLDEVIGNLCKNFAEGTEYFKLLVDVFAPEFRNSKNMHLRNFFIILPPLTLNFVEHMINSKEKLNKKNKIGAAFTDDGFAMGVAYILKLLDQYHEFDSLHWFQSVQERYNKEKSDIKKQPVTARMDEKLQQTMTLTSKRLDVHQQEFDLLYYSLASARIFFRADKTAAEERDDAKEQKGPLPVVAETKIEPSAGSSASSSGVAPVAPSTASPPPPPPPLPPLLQL